MRYLNKISDYRLTVDAYLDAFFDKNNKKIKPITSGIYLYVHYILGFLIFWLIKYHADTYIPEDATLAVTGGIETLWLIGCVYWGNLGWDINKNLLANGTLRDAFIELFRTTFPTLTLLPGLLYNFIAFHNIAEHDHSLIFSFKSPAIVWVICAVVVLFFSYFFRKASQA